MFRFLVIRHFLFIGRSKMFSINKEQFLLQNEFVLHLRNKVD